jgi:hypothetical protein
VNAGARKRGTLQFMKYDMKDFLVACVARYQELGGCRITEKIKHVETPFLGEAKPKFDEYDLVLKMIASGENIDHLLSGTTAAERLFAFDKAATISPGAQTRENVILHRTTAEGKAREIINSAENGQYPITDEHVLVCLQLWGFMENTSRGNVMPPGTTFIYSDTLGIMNMSTGEKSCIHYPNFTKLLTRWLKGQLPADLRERFAFSSICINKNCGGRRHRNSNNVGPSLIRALGVFSGGSLNYWPEDYRRTPPEKLPWQDRISVDLRRNLMMFNGNNTHSVDSFEGERFTLVFFTASKWSLFTPADLKPAIACGINIPTKSSVTFVQTLLDGSGDEGHFLFPVPYNAAVAEPSLGEISTDPDLREYDCQQGGATSACTSIAALANSRECPHDLNDENEARTRMSTSYNSFIDQINKNAIPKSMKCFISVGDERYNRTIIEFCCGGNSLLGQRTKHSRGCRVYPHYRRRRCDIS